MKYVLIIVVITLSTCKSNPDLNYNLDKFGGKDKVVFRYKGFNQGLYLKLINNGKFIYQYFSKGCTGGGESEIVYGKYLLNRTKLTLVPDSLLMSILPYFSHSNPKTFSMKYGIDSLKIKTDYDLIKWGNTFYLISPELDINFRSHPILSIVDFDIDSIINKRNDYYEFADFYNKGLEPQEHGKYLIVTVDSLSKPCDSELDLTQVPAKWKYLFLTKPIEATIMDIKSEKKNFNNREYFIYKVVLNKGKKDNIRSGIELYDSTGNNYIKIKETNQDKCFGITWYEFRKGEMVKSTWKN